MAALMTDHSYEADCLFCKIANHAITPAAAIFEDADTIAFLDIHPRSPGHTMVIPKHHAGKLADLPDAALAPLFSTVKRVAAMLEQALAPDGLTIGINQGEASGQEVAHLHIHLMPRFSGDGGGAIQSLVNRPPTETIQAIAEKIRNAN